MTCIQNQTINTRNHAIALRMTALTLNHRMQPALPSTLPSVSFAPRPPAQQRRPAAATCYACEGANVPLILRARKERGLSKRSRFSIPTSPPSKRCPLCAAFPSSPGNLLQSLRFRHFGSAKLDADFLERLHVYTHTHTLTHTHIHTHTITHTQ
jgi:hypothetical protein